MNKRVTAVIGRGFGDEGKGLATDWLCLNRGKSLVVKHNGGAQAGHTVDLEDGRRFVFHQLGSGSFRGATTFWAPTYLPDLYKLSEEYNSFCELAGFEPLIYSDPEANVVIILDIIVNHAIETHRGDKRHGSCGMGINEADLRTKAGFGIKISELSLMTVDQLVKRMQYIRKDYFLKRLLELGISELNDEFKELFFDDTILENVASEMLENIKLVKIKYANDIFVNYENIVFETGQGLLLDGCNEKYFPHVTASRTGLTNIIDILSRANLKLDEVVYVTRSYITRHGAGPLLHEVTRDEISYDMVDLTNHPNEWQGTLRYGLFDSIDNMLEPVMEDVAQAAYADFNKSLLITHLNETGNMIMLYDEKISVPDFIDKQGFLDRVYFSDTKLSKDIK